MRAQAPLVAPSGRSTQRNGIMTGRKSDPVTMIKVVCRLEVIKAVCRLEVIKAVCRLEVIQAVC